MILYNECSFCKLYVYSEYHEYYCEALKTTINSCHDCARGKQIMHDNFNKECERIKKWMI